MLCRFSSKSFSSVADLSNKLETLFSFFSALSHSNKLSELHFLKGDLENSFGISDDHWTDFLCCRCCFSVLSTFVASFCGAQVVLCARLLLVDATRPRIILNSTPIHFVLSCCLHVRKRSVYRFQWDIQINSPAV